MATNDNDPTVGTTICPSPGDHGRAALLLVESLIHGLRENATLSAHEAIEIAERAAEVQLAQAEVLEGADASLRLPHALLMSIVVSLRTDIASWSPPRPIP